MSLLVLCGHLLIAHRVTRWHGGQIRLPMCLRWIRGNVGEINQYQGQISQNICELVCDRVLGFHQTFRLKFDCVIVVQRAYAGIRNTSPRFFHGYELHNRVYIRDSRCNASSYHATWPIEWEGSNVYWSPHSWQDSFADRAMGSQYDNSWCSWPCNSSYERHYLFCV